jgi:hypothetical protein
VQVHWPRYRTISQVPPVTERCDALTVSQGFFDTPLGWSQHMYAHVMKVV